MSQHFLTAVHVWAAAAWADGVIADAEALTMKALIQAAKLTEEERATARRWIDQKVRLDDVDLTKLQRDEWLHIYSVACGVVAMDREVAAMERGFLERLRNALQLDEADARKARDAAGLGG
jgi:uncharacterized membrane protein YebE (DUF533 family)